MKVKISVFFLVLGVSFFCFTETGNQKQGASRNLTVSAENNAAVKKPQPQSKKIIEIKREIYPYTNPLPEIPADQDVFHGFPDTNNNGVRDDIEIAVAEEFEDDYQLVEIFFASARAAQKDLLIAQHGSFDPETLRKSMKRVEIVAGCGHLYFDDFYQSEYEFDWLSMYNLLIFSKTFNTQQKRAYLDSLQSASHGLSGGFEKVNHEICQRFNSESVKFVQ